MPNRNLALRRPPQTAAWQGRAIGWHGRASLATLGSVALATLAAGIFCLWTHPRAVDAEQVLAPAGIACLASCLAQTRWILAGWRNHRLSTDLNPLGHAGFWLGLLTAAFFSYLALLAVGPLPYLAWAWVASVAVCWSILLLPLAASPRVLEGWRHWSQGRRARRLNWLVVASILLLVGAEASLRVDAFAVRRGWLTGATPLERIDGFSLSATAAELPPLNLAIDEFRAQPFRVAVLGDEAELGGAARSGMLQRVQEMLPGLEIVSLAFGSQSSSPGPLSARLASCRPDLVLVALSPCADLAQQADEPSWFDWRRFELARWAIGTNRAAETGPADAPAVCCNDFENHLRRLAPQLAACRTPLDEAMRTRWQRTFAALDELLADCRARRTPLAVVLLPGQFQMNRELFLTLVRRTGSTADRFDVELPQRRLADFAQQRGVPVLDLLPHLKLSPQSLYERNARSWNEHGHEAAASALGHWLESRYGAEPALAARLSRAP